MNRSIGKRIAPLAAVLLLLLLNAVSAPYAGGSEHGLPESVRKAVADSIRKDMRKNDVVGLSIAVVDDQRVLWSEGFGYADKKGNVLATPDTIYRLGSMTRLFTATAAMILAGQGRLNLDKPVTALIPELSLRTRQEPGRPFTVRDLLTHHSGLPSFVLKGAWSRRPGHYHELLNLLKDEYVSFPPGAVFADSPVDSTIAGIIIERANGKDYRSFLREALFLPLGMQRSDVPPGGPVSGQASLSYRDGDEAEDPPTRDLPAAGMVSTVRDLGVFMQMMLSNGTLNGRQIMTAAARREMLRPQNGSVPLDLGLRMGLGWALSGLGSIDIRNAGTVAHRSGATLVSRGQMILLPDQRLGVVVLANSSSSARVVNNAATQVLTLLLEERIGVKQPQPARVAEADQHTTPEAVREYSGKYASPAGLAEIMPRPDHFHAEVMGRTFQLVPAQGGAYGIRYLLFGLFSLSLGELDRYTISRATVAGRDILKISTGGRDFLAGEKIRAAAVPASWKERTGEYMIENCGDDILPIKNVQLVYDDGLLLAEIETPMFKGTFRFPLMPLNGTEALIAGVGYGLGGTVRVVTVNGREALVYSGYVLRRADE